MFSRRLYRAKLLEKVWGQRVVELEEVKFFSKFRPEVTSVSFRESISSLGALMGAMSLWISWANTKAIGMPALPLVTQPECVWEEPVLPCTCGSPLLGNCAERKCPLKKVPGQPGQKGAMAEQVTRRESLAEEWRKGYRV